jgi:hypothetical protein
LAFFLAFFICLRTLLFFLFFLPVRKSASEWGARPHGPHRHAIELASRRRRGGHDSAVCGDVPRHLIMHCFLPMMAVPVVAVGKPRALLYDESAYESDWQWLPLARRQRYRDYLMRVI